MEHKETNLLVKKGGSGEGKGEARMPANAEPERTWCDLAALLGFADLVAAGDHLLCWKYPRTTLKRLTDAVARYPSQRGRTVLPTALAALSTRSRSRPARA